MRIALALPALLAGLVLTACGGDASVNSQRLHGSSGSGSTGASTSASTTGGSTGTTASTTTTGTSATTGTTATTTSGGSTGGNGCSDAAKLVYVVDENNGFYAFHAGASPSFTPIGTLNCPASGGATPFSMSVDRNATAWVLYSDGEIFKVSTADASCTPTSYDASATNWSQFGMGFVTDQSGGTSDTLFIAKTGKLGTLNTQNLTVQTVGNLNGEPELTGTGTAELWGFYPDTNGNPRVSRLDKTNGSELASFPLSPLAGTPIAWAFAFWGGDFWIFLARDTDNSTNVWHVNGQTGAVNEVMHDTGLIIVGAGVSTCAPVVFN